ARRRTGAPAPGRPAPAPAGQSRSRWGPSRGAAARPGASAAVGRRSGPGRPAAGTSGQACPKLRDRLDGAVERQRVLFLAAPDLGVDLPGLQPAFADREPQRAAEQLRVGELLAGAALAVVVEHVEAVGAEVVVELVRDL